MLRKNKTQRRPPGGSRITESGISLRRCTAERKQKRMKEKIQKEFSEVKMYKCNYCGKLFKTDHKHNCKFFPRHKNCFSCRHFIYVREAGIEYCMPFVESGDTWLEEREIKIVECEKRINATIDQLKTFGWSLNCSEWEMAEDYRGKDSFLAKVRQHEFENMKGVWDDE